VSILFTADLQCLKIDAGTYFMLLNICLINSHLSYAPVYMFFAFSGPKIPQLYMRRLNKNLRSIPIPFVSKNALSSFPVYP
jgi:hypothetical protein